jgi:hypothetical protein
MWESGRSTRPFSATHIVPSLGTTRVGLPVGALMRTVSILTSRGPVLGGLGPVSRLLASY